MVMIFLDDLPVMAVALWRLQRTRTIPAMPPLALPRDARSPAPSVPASSRMRILGQMLEGLRSEPPLPGRGLLWRAARGTGRVRGGKSWGIATPRFLGYLKAKVSGLPSPELCILHSFTYLASHGPPLHSLLDRPMSLYCAAY